MKFQVTHQDSYSRGELLLRSFFGIFYIQLPHMFVLLFIQIGAMFINFIAFWAILFTGNYPRGMWNYMVKWLRWNWRLSARLNNLADGYPAFGLNASDDKTVFEIEYPERSSRGTLLLRTFFGFFYIFIPHGFCLLFLTLGSIFVRVIAWWAVLITGKYPKGMHDYMVGVMRWTNRVMAYYYNLTDTYPPFSMKETDATSQALDHNI